MLYTKDHYSFSCLQEFEQCPYSFYLERIEGSTTKDNAFAQYGTLMHEIIDKWASKEISTEEMPFVWEEQYPLCVTERWPAFLASKGYAEKAYEKGYNYLAEFDSFNDYEIIDTEHSFAIDINGRKFVGIIDMIAIDKKTGMTVLIDHKSKSKASFKSSKRSMFRQLYLYSLYYKQEYGKYPEKLAFNLFKEDMIVQEDFDEDMLNEAIEWATNVMKKIESYDMIDFLETREDEFFCRNLCNSREHCLS